MSRDRSITGLRQQTADAAEAHQRAQARRDQEASTPMAGDLYVLQITRNWPVEWAVVRLENDARAWVVPADTQPLLGPGDLAVAPEDGGPLQLRCAFGTWVDQCALVPAHRSGCLTPAIVAAANAIRCSDEATAAARAAGEIDPSYEDWLDDVLIPARAALTADTRESQR